MARPSSFPNWTLMPSIQVLPFEDLTMSTSQSNPCFWLSGSWFIFLDVPSSVSRHLWKPVPLQWGLGLWWRVSCLRHCPWTVRLSSRRQLFSALMGMEMMCTMALWPVGRRRLHDLHTLLWFAHALDVSDIEPTSKSVSRWLFYSFETIHRFLALIMTGYGAG